MKLRMSMLALSLVAVATLATTSMADEKADKKALKEFYSVWKDKKATGLEKQQALSNFSMDNVTALEGVYDAMDSEVFQYRTQAVLGVRGAANEEMLAQAEVDLFEDKKMRKRPAVQEHLLWALFNNKKFTEGEKGAERWARLGELIQEDKYAEKVRARAIRELGSFKGDMNQAIANVKLLVKLLRANMDQRKSSRNLRFLLIDGLEGLTSEEHGDDIEKWEFWAKNDIPEKLKLRTATKFKDDFGDVEIEGHTFVRKKPRDIDLEVLILPDLYKSEQYWYPYIFELNKMFECTFVKLPDCSKMKDIDWMKDPRTGAVNRTAYYYPLEQLVEKFEERRKKSGQKKIGIIAHGVSAWIAQVYCIMHPESVAFAVFLQTWSGQNSREKARSSTEGSKDEAFKQYGISLVYDPSGRTGSLSQSDEDKFWAQAGAFKRRWADPKALEPLFYAGENYRVRPESNARILVPKYEFDREAKKRRTDVPVLFVHGTQDPMYVKGDAKDYKKGFTNMTWLEFENSADTPWAEEPVRFFEAIEKLIEDNDIKPEEKD